MLTGRLGQPDLMINARQRPACVDVRLARHADAGGGADPEAGEW
jgi:hypothetical protein